MNRPDAWNTYDPKRSLPLSGYITLLSTYGSLLGAGFALLAKRGLLKTSRFERKTAFLDAPPLRDVAMLAVATHELSWLVARDKVIGPIRAPFTENKGTGGAGEVNDAARGTGVKRAIGELLTCPYCLTPWVATALVFARVLQPRATRLGATVLSIVAATNVLHQGYSLLKNVDKKS